MRPGRHRMELILIIPKDEHNMLILAIWCRREVKQKVSWGGWREVDKTSDIYGLVPVISDSAVVGFWHRKQLCISGRAYAAKTLKLFEHLYSFDNHLGARGSH
jgi:hypothetical protein